MKQLTLLLTLGLFALLTAFEQEETLLTPEEATPETEATFRDDCTDYRHCSDLAGTRPMNFAFGPAASPDAYENFGTPVDFCADPSIPPLVFKLSVDVRRPGERSGRSGTSVLGSP